MYKYVRNEVDRHQSNGNHRRMNFKIQLYPTLLAILAGASADKIYDGQVTFVPAGEVASPVSYETLGLRVSTAPLLKVDQDIEERTRTYLEAIKRTIDKKDPGANSTQVTDRIYQRIRPEMEELQHSVAELAKVLQLTMGKRSAALLLGTLVGSVAAIGSALFTHGEVTALANRLERSNRKVAAIAHDMKIIRHTFSIRQARLFNRMVEDETVAAIKAAISKTTRHVDNMLEGYYALREHRLHPAFVPPAVLERIQRQMTSYSRETGASPVFSLKNELMNVPISWAVGGGNILILPHLPFVKDGRVMLRQLYRLDNAILRGSNRLVQLRSDAPYISIDRRRQIHQVTTTAEMQQCLKIGSKYLCDGQAIFQKQVTTCTAALFFKQTLRATQLCPSETFEVDQPAIRLNDTSYAVQKNIATELQCPGKEISYKTTTQDEIVHVPRGCTLNSAHFIISPSLTEHRETVVVDHEVELPSLILAAPESENKPTMEEIKLDFDNYSPIDDVEEEAQAGIWIGLGLLTVAPLIGIAAAIIYCRRKKTTSTSSAPPQLVEDTPSPLAQARGRRVSLDIETAGEALDRARRAAAAASLQQQN